MYNAIDRLGKVAPFRSRHIAPLSHSSIITDQAAWDASVIEGAGHFHQSWKWGAFRARHGWQVTRLRVEVDRGVGLVQILFKKTGPFTTAFIDRGPVILGETTSVLPALLNGIHQVCKEHGSLNVVIEPDREPSIPLVNGAQLRPVRELAPKTVLVPLLEDDALLAQMTRLGRRKIRTGIKEGAVATVREPDAATKELFYTLLRDTAQRNGFGTNPASYYNDFIDLMGDDAALICSEQNGEIGAAMICAIYGKVATYQFGATSSEHRTFSTAAVMHYEAMRWARSRGCTHYDLLGIDEPDIAMEVQPWTQSLDGKNREGLVLFKTRFGGEIVSYPPSVEFQYRPALGWAFQQAKSVQRRVRK